LTPSFTWVLPHFSQYGWTPTRGRELLNKTWIGLAGIAIAVVALLINPANLARVTQGIGQRSDFIEVPLPWVRAGEVVDPNAFDWALLWNNLWNIPGLWLGIFGGFPWGSLGWLDTSLPQIVLTGTLLVVVGVAFVALKAADPKKVVGLLLTLGALWLMPLYIFATGWVPGG